MIKQASKAKTNYPNAMRASNGTASSIPKVTKATKFTGATNTKTLALKKPHKKMM